MRLLEFLIRLYVIVAVAILYLIFAVPLGLLLIGSWVVQRRSRKPSFLLGNPASVT